MDSDCMYFGYCVVSFFVLFSAFLYGFVGDVLFGVSMYSLTCLCVSVFFMYVVCLIVVHQRCDGVGWVWSFLMACVLFGVSVLFFSESLW